MLTLTAAQTLDAWDSARHRSPVDRALHLLAAAHPDLPSSHLADLAIGSRDRALLQLRIALFGDRVPATSACPGCGTELQFDLQAEDLMTPVEDRDMSEPVAPEMRVDVGSRTVVCRAPDSIALRAASAVPAAEAARVLLGACIVAIDPEATPDDLTDAEVAALAERMAEVDPDADVSVALTCVDCEQPFDMAFAIDLFLWDELDRWARRTIDEVDALAGRYGWSESDILAMSAGRRQCYLEAGR